MTEQVRVHFAVTSNMSPFIKDVQKANAAVAQFNATSGMAGMNFVPKAALQGFREIVRQSGSLYSETVQVRTESDKFAESLNKGKLSMREAVQAVRAYRKEAGVINQLAKKNVSYQQAAVIEHQATTSGKKFAEVIRASSIDLSDNATKTKYLNERLRVLNQTMRVGSEAMVNWGKNTQWAGRQMMVGMTIPLTLLAGAASMAFNTMDKELIRIQKVYGSGLNIGESFKKEGEMIREEAIKLSKELAQIYGQSFEQTLQLTADIAATGKEGAELLDSVRETTRLATLGEIDRQEAMKATLSLQTAFKMNNEELTKSINFLNAVENETSATLNDLVEAIPRAGSTVKSLGGDVQDLALYMVALREGGIQAGEGANALKSGLAAIVAPSKVAADYAESFGISLKNIVDSNPGDLTGKLLDLQKALSALGEEDRVEVIAKIFGRYQMNRWSALLSNLGAEASQTNQVLNLMNESTETLAKTADQELATAMESASGKFKIAVETMKQALAVMGEDFLGTFTSVVNVIAGIIEKFNNLDGTIKSVIKIGAIIGAVIGPIVMTVGVLGNFLGYLVKLGLALAGFATNRGLGRLKSWNAEMAASEAIAERLASGLKDPFLQAEKAVDRMTLAVKELQNALLQTQSTSSSVIGMLSPNVSQRLLGTNVAPGTGLQGAILSNAAQNNARQAAPWTVQEFSQLGRERQIMAGVIVELANSEKAFAKKLRALGNSAQDANIDIQKFESELQQLTNDFVSSAKGQDILQSEVRQSANGLEYLQSVLARWSAFGTSTRGGGSRETVRGANILGQEAVKSFLSNPKSGQTWANPSVLSQYGIQGYAKGTKGESAIIGDVLSKSGVAISASGKIDYAGYSVPTSQAEHALPEKMIRQAWRTGGQALGDQEKKATVSLNEMVATLRKMIGTTGNADAAIQTFVRGIGLSQAEVQQFANAVNSGTAATNKSAAAANSQASIMARLSTLQSAATVKSNYQDLLTQYAAIKRGQTGIGRKVSSHEAWLMGKTGAKDLSKWAAQTRAKAPGDITIQERGWLKGFDALEKDRAQMTQELNGLKTELKKAKNEVQKFGAEFENTSVGRINAEIKDLERELQNIKRKERNAAFYKRYNQAHTSNMPEVGDFGFFSKSQKTQDVKLAREEYSSARKRVRQLRKEIKSGWLRTGLYEDYDNALKQSSAARRSLISAVRQNYSLTVKSGDILVRAAIKTESILTSAAKKLQSGMSTLWKKHSVGLGMALSSLSMLTMVTGQASGTGAAQVAINAASMAGMGAGMGMMFGAPGAIIGASAGALVGTYQKLSEASKVAAERAGEFAQSLRAATSKVSDSLLKLAGVTEEQIKLNKENRLDAGKRASDSVVIASGYDQKVLEQEKERIEAFAKLSSDQALTAALSLYQQLVFGGATEGAAQTLVDSVVRQAGKKEILMDMSAEIRMLDDRGNKFEPGKFIDRQIKSVTPAVQDGLKAMAGDFFWQADFLKDGQISELGLKIIDPLSKTIADSIATAFQKGIRDGIYSVEEQNLISEFMKMSSDSISKALESSFEPLSNLSAKMNSSTSYRYQDEANIADYLGKDVSAENFWDKYYSVPPNIQNDIKELMSGVKDFEEQLAVSAKLREDQVASLLSSMTEEQAAYVESLAAPFQEGVDALDKLDAVALAASVTLNDDLNLVLSRINEQLTNGGDRATVFSKALKSTTSPDIIAGIELYEKSVAKAAGEINDLYNKLDEKPVNLNIDSTSASLAEARILGVNIALSDLEEWAKKGIEVDVKIRQQVAEKMVVTEREVEATNRKIIESMTSQSATDAEIDDIQNALEESTSEVDKAFEAEKDASDERVKNYEEASKDYLDALQEESSKRVEFVDEAIKKEQELREKGFDKEIETLQQAIEDKQNLRKQEIDDLKEFYNTQIQGIRDEQKAKDDAAEKERKRLDRLQQMRDLQLKLMEGVATGDAFAVLGAQMQMQDSQKKWQQEDADELQKRQSELAIQQIEQERDARVAAAESAAEKERQLDEEKLERQKEYGKAILEYQKELDSQRIEAYRNQENDRVEAAREAEAQKIEFVRALEEQNLEARKVQIEQEKQQFIDAAKQQEEAVRLKAAVEQYWLGQTSLLQTELIDQLTNQKMTIEKIAEKHGVSVEQMTHNIAIAIGEEEKLATSHANLVKIAIQSSRLMKLVSDGLISAETAESSLDAYIERLTRSNTRKLPDHLITRANGGPINGPGTSKSDSIPALLSDGEYVMQASAVDKYGLGFMDSVNARRFASGGAVVGKDGLPTASAETFMDFGAIEIVKQLAMARTRADSVSIDSDKALFNQKEESLKSLQKMYFDFSDEKMERLSESVKSKLDASMTLLQDSESYFKVVSESAQTYFDFYKNGLSETAKLALEADKLMIDSAKMKAGVSVLELQKILDKNKSVVDESSKQWEGWAKSTSTNIEDTGEALVSTFTNIDYGALVKMVEAYAGGRQDEGDKLKGEILKRAYGGYVSGPGTATSDSIPALLSNGEYVIRQRAVQKYGVDTMNQINAGRFAEGGIVGSLGGSISDKLNKVVEEKIQNAINNRANQFTIDETGEVVDWSKIPEESYGYPFSGGTTYSGGNHGIDGLGAIDFGRPQAPFGAPIRPAGPGYAVVRGEGYPDIGRRSDGGGAGNWLYVNHVLDGKPYTSVYMHLKQGSTKVKTGDLVTRRTVLGNVGASGHVIPAGIDGSHLHFEFGSGHGAVARKQTQTLFPSVADAYNKSKGFPTVLGGPGLMSFVSSGVPTAIGMNPASWALKASIAGMAASVPGGLSMSDASFPGITSNVSRWSDVVTSVLDALGLSRSYLPGILRQMQQESGGDPNAVNNWDINAQRGIPSKGLLQTILPTFLAYAPENMRSGEFHTNPYANIFAGVNYARTRYGEGKFDLWNAGFNQAYAGGGLVIPALRSGATVNYDNTLANLHRGETVLTAPLTQKLKDGVDVASSQGTSYTVNVNINKAQANANEIEAAVFSAIERKEKKLGRSRVIGAR